MHSRLPQTATVAALLLAAVLIGGTARASEDGSPRGVNPKDLVTKIDLIFRTDRYDGGAHLDTVVFKYDRALGPRLGVAVEVPFLAFFDGPGVSERGIAESKLKLRYVDTHGRLSLLAGGEVVVPTNTEDSLGSGKWQVNPSAGAVYALTPRVFVFAGYQHFFSVAGKSAAATINQSQPRLLAALTSPAGWWIMADLKYTRDHEANKTSFDTELEAGRMLSPGWGVSFRVISSSMDSPRDWAAVLNVRHLF